MNLKEAWENNLIEVGQKLKLKATYVKDYIINGCIIVNQECDLFDFYDERHKVLLLCLDSYNIESEEYHFDCYEILN